MIIFGFDYNMYFHNMQHILLKLMFIILIDFIYLNKFYSYKSELLFDITTLYGRNSLKIEILHLKNYNVILSVKK